MNSGHSARTGRDAGRAAAPALIRTTDAYICGLRRRLPHRASAPCLPMACRSSAVRLFARALPPRLASHRMYSRTDVGATSRAAAARGLRGPAACAGVRRGSCFDFRVGTVYLPLNERNPTKVPASNRQTWYTCPASIHQRRRPRTARRSENGES
jgi:hypothetical protein